MATLPNELASLIHHVELNRAGWWDKAIERMLLSTLWAERQPLTVEDLTGAVYDRLGVEIVVGKVERRVEVLVSQGKAVITPDNEVKLSEQTRQELDETTRSGSDLDRRVRERFARELEAREIPVEPAEAWKRFDDEYLTPLIQDLGAKTYELISGGGGQPNDLPNLHVFLRKYDPDLREALQDALNAFFDPEDPAVRSYILRNLNAVFLLQAGSLPSDALEGVVERTRGTTEFTVFVDTNFLFSILELHENPSNDAARALFRLLGELSGKINARIYALPTTFEEMVHTLGSYSDSLSSLRLTPNVSRALQQGNLDLSGVAMRFVLESARAKKPLNSRAYFEPYIKDPVTIARGRGVELYNADLSGLSTDQDVIDDIVDQQAYEKRRYGEDRAKSYQALKHDMILWHFTKRKRPDRIESPLDARYWVVTVDYRLIRFDEHKLRTSARKTPICVPPAALIQLLQLWLPRSEEVEAALISAIRPLLPQRFDPEAERVTLKILSTLSRYENLDDMSTETATAVLLNQALRSRLQEEVDEEVQHELVHEAILEEDEKIRQELSDKAAQARELELTVQEQSKQLETLKEDRRKADEEYAEQLEDERSKRVAVEGRLESVEQQLERQSQERELDLNRRRRGWFLAVSGLAALLLSWGSNRAIATWSPIGPYLWLEVVGWIAIALLVWTALVDLLGRRVPGVSDSRPFLTFRKAAKVLYGAAGTIILGVVAGVIAGLILSE